MSEKTLRWFPDLSQYVENRNRASGDKAFLFHHKFQPEKILSNCPLKAVIALKVEEGGESWLEPVDPQIGVSALAVSTLWQLTHTGFVAFNHLKRIGETLPCYLLHLGSDLTQAPRMIEELL